MRKEGKLIILFFMVLQLFTACNFFNSFKKDESIKISDLSFSKKSLSISVGEMTYLSVSIKPAEVQKDVILDWSYDKNIISVDSSSWGATITGLKEGQTNLKCVYNGYEANCVISVKGFSETYEEVVEPYIYSNTTIIQTTPGISEKVYCSLYGGSAADIDGYSWTIDNPAVASLEPTGQYCIITAREAGYARIKVTHTKATYPYYIGIYVFEDSTNISYITTSDNILTMNMEDEDRTISVSLVNGKKESSDSSFSWEIINEKENTELPIKYDVIGNKAVITPVHAGFCTLRVTHPDAVYPLDILCRVISIVKNVYIEPEQTVITLSGTNEQTVKSTLKNIEPGEYNIDAFTYVLDDYNVAEIIGWVGNEVMLKGKANGSCKLIISHEKAEYSREILVIVNGQLTDAIDSSCYITTSQNYIRTKVGADGIYLNISLKGGVAGDENGFLWTVKSSPFDNSENDVISMETTHGNIVYSRAAEKTFAYGQVYIEPKFEGTAVITITHPKVVYPTEILIKVLSEDAILEEPLYLAGQGIIRLLNGSSIDYEVQLKGKNKTNNDDSNINWNVDNTFIELTANSNIAHIKAPAYGSGNTISNLTISHCKADTDKKVLILTADSEEDLANMNALYSDKLYYNIGIGDTAYCMTNYVGFDTIEFKIDEQGQEYKEITEFDFSSAIWTVSDSSICSVEKDENDPLVCKVTGLKAGNTKITISVKDLDNRIYTCSYEITVYPEGAVQLEPEVYFTTTQNVVNIASSGKEKIVNVSAINLLASKYSEISWTCENENIAKVIGNGTCATISAVTEGETIIYVTHEDSQNVLKIYVRIGSEYVIQDATPIVYISSTDVITMLKDEPAQRLDAILVNYDGIDKTGFSFEIDNESVASISSQTTNGIAYITPVDSGQAEITIKNPKSNIDKKVLVVVGNSLEDLSGYTYLTTNSNVVAIGEGTTKTVTVSVKNSEEIIIDGYTWTSSDPSIISVVSQGTNAVLTGNSIGTAIITVTNRNCTYSLQIIAQCVDPIAAAANPYIQLTSSVLTLNVSSSYSSITAELVGGTEDDLSDFSWTSNDTTICVCYGQNEIGKIKALKEGTSYITVSHPKAAYPAQLLVVCDKVEESECYISVPSSIINMKPTDSAQTITASLINGTTTDKYNFTWSLDVYDVIDFVYSANVCTIEPKQQGQATITIHHPKAAYDQQIIVTVQEYTTFAFPQEYVNITQGNVVFETMQVPNTKVSTYVKYSVDNSNICSISGTKTTAQITAINPGTTNVHAQLIASSTGVVQASAEMMVYVKEAPVNACYITSPSTIYTVQKGKSQTLSANITGSGIITSDQQNLKWSSSDTDIISIAGINTSGVVTGQSIYITALKPGEALITCSHEKAASDLQFFIVVPGSGEKTITLNKSFVTLVKGSSGTTLKVNIENAESSNDYNDLIWTVENVGESEVCRIMGSGQNVTIYPLNVGEAEILCQLPNISSVAKCTVKVEAGKSFTLETTGVKVQPFKTKKIKYTVSPPTANLTWTTNQADEFFTYKDLGCDSNGIGYVEIEGIKEGSGNLYCVTDGNAKGNLQVRVAWDYEFSLTGKTMFTLAPNETAEVGYVVNPANADITVLSTDDDYFSYTKIDNGDGTGKITIKALAEVSNNITIKLSATNPNNNNELIGNRTITANFKYTKLTPKIELVSKVGKYSAYENEVLKLGDGESVEFKFGIKETQASGRISNVKFVPQNTTKDYVRDSFISNSGLYNLSDAQGDKIEYTTQYRISNLYVPYKQSVSVKNNTNSAPSISYGNKVYVNWKTDLKWRAYYKTEEHLFQDDEIHDYFGLAQVSCYKDEEYPYIYGSSWWQGFYTDGSDPNYQDNDTSTVHLVDGGVVWGLEEDISLRNTVMSEEEFLNCAWLYCPGTPSKGKAKLWVTYEDFQKSNLIQGGYGTNSKINKSAHVMTQHVTATKEQVVCTDTTLKSSSLIGYLEVTIEHLGLTQEVVNIPVYYYVRDCPNNY